MTAIKDLAHNGQTVVYNGIRFDGVSSNTDGVSKRSIRLIPPTITLDTSPQYDEAGRVVVHHTHVLTVSTIVYSTDTSDQTQQIEVIRRRLLEPGGQLTLTGMGLGFPESRSETSTATQSDIIDVSWGPKPLQCAIKPFGGDIAHEVVWAVEFRTAPCVAVGYDKNLVVKALNYETSWSNDDQGFTTRNIAGYIEIQQPQGSNQTVSAMPNTRLRAETARDAGTLAFAIPAGFRRVSNVWNESMDRSRMDFSVTDAQLRGDAYPADIIDADGKFSEIFDPVALGTATASLRMTLVVRKGVHPSVAAVRFLQIAAAKQKSMEDRSSKSSVVARNMFIEAGMFDDARATTFGIQWMTTGCVENFLFNTPWEKIPGVSESLWKQSIASVWSNRGNTNTRPTPDVDAIVDVCGSFSKTVGATVSGVSGDAGGKKDKLQLPCGVEEKTSWLNYDVQVMVKRKENKSLHVRAISVAAAYVPIVAAVRGLAEAFKPVFSTTSTTEHVSESNGYPTQTIVLQMKGMRVGFEPDFPVITSIDGKAVEPFGERVFEKSVVAKIGGCSVYSIRGYQIYTVKEYVSDFKAIESKTICDESEKSASDGKI